MAGSDDNEVRVPPLMPPAPFPTSRALPAPAPPAPLEPDPAAPEVDAPRDTLRPGAAPERIEAADTSAGGGLAPGVQGGWRSAGAADAVSPDVRGAVVDVPRFVVATSASTDCFGRCAAAGAALSTPGVDVGGAEAACGVPAAVDGPARGPPAEM